MTHHIRRGARLAFFAAILALTPGKVLAQPYHFLWTPEWGGSSSFSVSLSESRFRGGGSLGESSGFLGHRTGTFFDIDLALTPSPISPLCRAVAGVLTVDSVRGLARDAVGGEEIVINMTGTICLDPNKRQISGEGEIEFVSWATSRTGEATVVHSLSGTGAWRLLAALDDSGAAGTISEFEFSGFMEHGR